MSVRLGASHDDQPGNRRLHRAVADLDATRLTLRRPRDGQTAADAASRGAPGDDGGMTTTSLAPDHAATTDGGSRGARGPIRQQLITLHAEINTLRARIAETRAEIVDLRQRAGLPESSMLPGSPVGPGTPPLIGVTWSRPAVVWRFHARWRMALPPRNAALLVALSLLAAVTCLAQIGTHLPAAYNWENYTAWEFFQFWDAPHRAIFTVTDGLMTESGSSPLVILPAWLGFGVGGVGLTSLRVPLALLAAGSVPLLWWVGRGLVGERPAILAAVLLAISPAFVLYARTATLVGPSVTISLLTILALLRVLDRPWSCRWLVALQVLLVAGMYAYAPIRFLWPIGVTLLVMEGLRRGARWWCIVASLITLGVLPLALIGLDRQESWGPIDAVRAFYNGRGEQILALTEHPADYTPYLGLSPAEQARLAEHPSVAAVARRLVEKNARDSLDLLVDWRTRPAFTDYWNPHGRLYPAVLVPFFVLGLGAALARAPRHRNDRVVLAFFFGFSLPLLLTTQIHIGRLIFAVPWLFLLVARGGSLCLKAIDALLSGVAARWSGGTRLTAISRASLPMIAAVVLVALTGRSAWTDYQTAPLLRDQRQTAATLAALGGLAQDRGGEIVMILGRADAVEIEAIDVAQYRLSLDNRYRFVDLTSERLPTGGDGGRPVVAYGGLLDRLTDPRAVPHFCDSLYVVRASLESEFLTETKPSASSCGKPLDYRTIPG